LSLRRVSTRRFRIVPCARFCAPRAARAAVLRQNGSDNAPTNLVTGAIAPVTFFVAHVSFVSCARERIAILKVRLLWNPLQPLARARGR
jgi:hypothetical protein